MAVYPHRQVELIGAGDLPSQGFIDKLVAFYGFIPLNRGNLDRKLWSKRWACLSKPAFSGSTPSGTWNPGRMKAKVGGMVKSQGQAPVIPIGFSGFHNGFSKVLKFERPTLKMSVGEPIPAFRLDNDSLRSKMLTRNMPTWFWKELIFWSIRLTSSWYRRKATMQCGCGLRRGRFERDG